MLRKLIVLVLLVTVSVSLKGELGQMGDMEASLQSLIPLGNPEIEACLFGLNAVTDQA